jgi:hypothetical protein
MAKGSFTPIPVKNRTRIDQDRSEGPPVKAGPSLD